MHALAYVVIFVLLEGAILSFANVKEESI